MKSEIAESIHVNRRQFIGLILGSVYTSFAVAQQSGKTHRIGWLRDEVMALVRKANNK